MGFAKQINALNNPAPCHLGLLCTSVHFNRTDNRLDTNNVIGVSVYTQEMRTVNALNFVTTVIIIQIGRLIFQLL